MSQVKGDDGSSGITAPVAGVWGDSQLHAGVAGTSDSTGVVGISKNAVGVLGQSGRGPVTIKPVRPPSVGVEGESAAGVGVRGWTQTGTGIEGTSPGGVGVKGTSKNSTGVYGFSDLPGTGTAPDGHYVYGGDGVRGENNQRDGRGVRGLASGGQGTGVWGESVSGYGVVGVSPGGGGVWGCSNESTGVWGESQDEVGVYGWSGALDGLRGEGTHAGVHARNWIPGDNTGPRPEAYLATQDLAGEFFGDVVVHGSLTKSGGGFRIDHPLDPGTKYLNHAFVESSEMKNVYDGVVILDRNGSGVVELPAWFETLNRDVRYQLTAIGAAAPNLHIAREVKGNEFQIAGGVPGMKVSWQVTGVRQDAWAKSKKIAVEQEKPAKERGYYLHPRFFDQPEEKRIMFARHPEKTNGAERRASEVEHLQALSRRQGAKPARSTVRRSPRSR